jgi:hypothetical protein
MLKLSDDTIKVVMLAAFGQKSKQSLFENTYLKALIDSFTRIPKNLKTEEAIRDAFVRDLETANPITSEVIQKQFLFLNWEKWINVSDQEKSRADIVFSVTGFEFVLECKLLKFADKEYIEEGVRRFVELKYAEKDDFAGMIGFIIKGKPHNIVKNLKNKVKDFHLYPESEELLQETVLNHPLSFQSKHLRTNQTPIHLYHIFFDLTETETISA